MAKAQEAAQIGDRVEIIESGKRGEVIKYADSGDLVVSLDGAFYDLLEVSPDEVILLNDGGFFDGV